MRELVTAQNGVKRAIRGWGAGLLVGGLLVGNVEGGDGLSTGLELPASDGQATLGEDLNWLTGEGVSLGGVLFPHLHVAGVFGGTTGASVERLAVGHHDPQATSTLQFLEPGVSLRLNDYVEGFATYSAYTDADGELDGDWEEAFLKLRGLPGGFELRGGRFLNRFGFQNSVHSHAWDQVNNTLLNGRMLQEGELAMDGGEITWNLPVGRFASALSFAVGQTAHSHHDHGHDHGHDHEGAMFEGEEAEFSGTFYAINLMNQLDFNDFHQNRVVLSAAWGDNEFGRSTQIYGVGYEYEWREKGYEPGGRYVRWRTEAAYRRFGAVGEEHEDEHAEHGHGHHDDHDDHDDEEFRATLDELGLYSMINYGINERVDLGLRAGWIAGIDEAGLDERVRLSPNVTFALNRQRTLLFRLQYDYDHSNDFGDAHSVWGQVMFNWGGPEVR